MPIHYHFKKNKADKVFVILKDGSTFIDRWAKPWEGKFFFFVEKGEMRIKKIRSIGIYRPNGSVEK